MEWSKLYDKNLTPGELESRKIFELRVPGYTQWLEAQRKILESLKGR